MDKAAKLDQLIDDAEELLTQLADAHDPEIQRLRDRVDEAIADAHRVIAQGIDDAVQFRDIAQSIDDYVRDYPWLAVLTGVVVAGASGFIAGAAIGAKKGGVRDWF